MESLPYGIHTLFITCSDPGDPQFRGVFELGDLLEKKHICHHFHWNNQNQDLSHRRVLEWVIISGHGPVKHAYMSDGHSKRLYPSDNALPEESHLFLMGCNQGQPSNIKKWAAQTGVEEEHIYGSEGESETVLSSLFLLHLLECSFQEISHWVVRWQAANIYFRPWFSTMRKIYKSKGKDFIGTLTEVEKYVDVSPFMDFIGVGLKYASFLSQLG
jgi:hypothetical protein